MKKIKFGEYFIQLLLVIVGVFLGMLASDWNSNKKQEENKKEVLSNIKSEITANKLIIESALKNKNQFYKSFDSIQPLLTAAELNEPLFQKKFEERFPNWNGVGGEDLPNAMFEMAKFSNLLSSMDIDVTSQLSKIYNLQNSYNDFRKMLLSNFFDFNSQTTYKDAMRFMWSVRQELGSHEVQLKKEYEKALQLLD